MKKWTFFVALAIGLHFYTQDWTTFERGVVAGFLGVFYAIYELGKAIDATNERLIKALGNGDY